MITYLNKWRLGESIMQRAYAMSRQCVPLLIKVISFLMTQENVRVEAVLSWRCTSTPLIYYGKQVQSEVWIFISFVVLHTEYFLLQNKIFIYRGKEYEWLEDFSLKLLSQFPNATRMTSTAPPGDNISNSSGQCILMLYNKPR